MDDTTDATATPDTIDNSTSDTPASEPVKDAAAVLAKNKELLGINKTLKSEVETIKQQIAAYEAEKAKQEEEKLAKRGDWDKLAERLKADHEAAIAEREARYEKRFRSDAEKDLRLALIAAEAFEDEPTVTALSTILLAKHIQPTDEDGITVWRTHDGEAIDLKDFITTTAVSTYGRFFKADNNPGGDAPGNLGKVSHGIKRSTMTRADKTAYIAKHGEEAYLNLPI